MKVAVIGTGYVGLVTGVCLSEYGHEVTCIDNNIDKVERLKSGDPIIFEPGLTRLMKSNSEAGRLHFTQDTASGVKDAEIVFLAVGTPPHPETGEADMAYIFAAAKEVSKSLSANSVVVTKSTVPVGTNRQIQKLIGDHAIASNPEFLREGSAVDDFMQPERVVVGVEDENAGDALRRLYHPLTLDNIPLVICDLETAEMSKYAANSFLATKVAFINEMADLCEASGADIRQVAQIMGLDERIGDKFLNPGPGIGGSCFPKDTLALHHTANKLGVDFRILESTIEANNLRKHAMAERIAKVVSETNSPTIAMLGITFKQNTDDIRESPALTIIQDLLERGYQLRIFDPKGIEAGKEHFANYAGQINWSEDSYDAAKGSDALAILTEWNIFRSLDLAKLKSALKQPNILDLRNVCDPKQMIEAGFNYQCIGRKA
jgi:UDPglucose 6-dehydrogenase